MNKWTGMGRLVRDPEVKFTKSGKYLARFTLAINYRSNGEYRAEFVKCKCWEKMAEIVGECYGKGDKLLVTGHLQTNKYPKDGITRYDTSVVAKRIECAEKKNKSTKQMPASEQQPLPEMPFGAVEEWPPFDQEQIFEEDDIPF